MKAFISYLFLLSCPLFAVSVYLDIQPGSSTQADVARSLGAPVRTLSASTYEYRPQRGTGPIFVDYVEGGVVGRIEVNFTTPVKRATLMQALKLPTPEFRSTSNARLMDYYGDTFSLVATYAAALEASGVVTLEYCSRDLYEKRAQVMLDAERRTSFQPAACKDLFDWAETEQQPAKKSKDPNRLQAILEIRILAQRGECDKARGLASTYHKK